MERFIIGTGRCGSTLLSNMLACHPEALIMQECLSAIDRLTAFKIGTVNKEELKKILSSNGPIVDLTVRRGNITKEQLYQVDNQEEFTAPALLIAALPALSDKPDELFSEMMAVVEGFPEQTLAEHYKAIFVWLQEKFNKSFWIERSGGSIEYLPKLYQFYPKAKYLHIHRSGPEAVMSMKNHAYFQMLVSFFSNPATRQELEQTELAGQTISKGDPISQRLFVNQPSYEEFAAYWNYQLLMGYRVFPKMDASQYLEIRFEDLINEPNKTLAKISNFFELPDNTQWIDQAVAMVDSNEISSSISQLPKAQQESLQAACISGQILLNRIEHPWIFSTLSLINEMSNRN